jgi:methylated-DNA-[protein]-cysteine S-methyltransferase
VSGRKSSQSPGLPNAAVGCGFLDVLPVDSRLWLAWNERALVQVSWEGTQLGAAATLGPDHPPVVAIPGAYSSVLRAYLAGEAVDPAQLPVEFAGTPFQAKVWQALRGIGRGQVKSYAAIANAVGSPRAMRAVGSANGKNPLAIVVPCHRVVETGMRLGGYTGGLHLKRFLLDLEGVRTTDDVVKPGQLDLL